MEQCHETCVMRDERWGEILIRCELGDGHEENRHQRTMNACTPLAVLSWE